MVAWKLRKFFNFLVLKSQKNALSIVADLPTIEMPQGKKILFIAPHPDDETIACGGFLYEASKKKNNIYITLISGGEKWGPKENRLKEFNLACRRLGINLSNISFLDFPDKFSKSVLNRVKLYKAIFKIYKEIKPHYLIYPSPLDLNYDHKIVGQTIDQFKKDNTIFLSYLIHYVSFPKPYRFRPKEVIVPPLKILKNHKWLNFFLNDKTLEKKHEAMLSYQTQLSVPGLRSLLLSFIRQNEIFILKT
jgi:LmbE family N-acetylglucosaminyl deacetylase